MKQTLQSLFVVLTLSIFATACGSKAKVTAQFEPSNPTAAKFYVVKGTVKPESKAPESFAMLTKEKIEAHLKKKNLLADNKTAADTYGINFEVTKYEMRNEHARMWLGVMAGVDVSDALVKITDSKGKPAGEALITGYNSLAVGSAETIAEGLGKEIAQYVTPKAVKK